MKYLLPFFFLAVSCLAQPSNPPVNVRVWGISSFTNVPSFLTNAVALSSSGFAAVRADGSVVFWDSGGTNIPANMTNCVAVEVGSLGALALNQSGQLIASGAPVPSDVTSAIAIAAGFKQSAAVRPDGTVVTWGGLASIPPSSATNVIAIALRESHYVVLKADGTVVSWGGFAPNNVPFGLSNVVAIAAGSGHSLALRQDGTVIAWGDNGYGQCNVPSDLTNAVSIGAGPYHSLAIKADGTVVAWGVYGGSGGPSVSVPIDLPFAQAVAGGSSSSMAIINPSHAPTPPVILSNPKSQTVASGASARFFVRAAGVLPFTYQWFHGTNALAEGTNSFLILNNVTSLDSGSYSVIVSNSAGGVASQSASLSVLPSLKIDLVPAISLIGDLGATFTLQYLNAVGPTNNWQTLAIVTLTNNPQFYPDYSAIGQPTRFYRLLQGP